ncbi:tetratricopeptide repeat protein [Novipirellula caenicola]|uniref:Beta-barrel assembly-enhancing protease n=1 Tax=Novipirellula caenicola TaxID=1536901 RepID=A0ABP9VVA1_9BACT
MIRFILRHFAAHLVAIGFATTLVAQTTQPDLQAARKAAAENPRDVALLLDWAEAAIQAREPVEALQAASSAKAIAPGDDAIAATLGRAQVLAGRLDDALQTIRSMPPAQQDALGLSTTADAIEIYQSIAPMYADAEQSGLAEDYRGVANRLSRAAELAPELVPVNRTLGFLFLDKLQQPQDALPLLERAHAVSPQDEETRLLLARARLEMGRFEDAVQLYRQLADQIPEDSTIQLNFAAALLGAKRWDASQAVLDEVLSQYPENKRAQELRSDLAEARDAAIDDMLPPNSDVQTAEALELLLEAGRLIAEGDASRCLSCFHRAIERLYTALEIEPNSHTLNQTIGYVLLEKLGQPEQAYHRLCVALRIQPDNLDTNKLMALAALRTGKTCEAIQRFKSVLRRDPDDLWMLVNLGRAYAQAGSFAPALAIYDQVLCRDPVNFNARLGIAEVEGWRGLSDRPICRVERLVSEQPDNSEALSLLGDLYRWDWNLSGAAGMYHRAAVADPAGRAGRQGLEEIATTQAYVATTDGYQFLDNFGFRRSVFGGGLRMALSDRGYLTTSVHLWDYEQGVIDLQRTDVAVEWEYHLNRHLQLNARFLNFDYSHRDSDQAGSLAMKYTPVAAIDLYASAAWGESAYLTDISIPQFNIRMDNYATGYDIDFNKHWSTQGSFSYSDYYDGNERRFGMAQLSYRPNLCRDWYLRVKYEDLSFADQTATYFSPDSFDLIRLITEHSIPLTQRLSLDAQGEAIDVLEEGWGWGYQVGGSWKYSDRVEMQAGYFATSIPAAAPFSGDGFTYSALLRF